jgi:DNA-3-methyladenine glycosylase I
MERGLDLKGLGKIFMDKSPTINRCFGNGNALYAQYHDEEWGIPSHDDRHLFEMLILDGAQAGLSWETILKKREGYRQAFHHFDPKKVANMSDAALAELRENPSIIRNRLKIESTRKNAQVFLEIQKEWTSFHQYLWHYVDGTPIINHWTSFKDAPTKTPLSDRISKDLKKRGMSFVGPTIIYAYLQAVGVVNDHMTSCCKYIHHTKK